MIKEEEAEFFITNLLRKGENILRRKNLIEIFENRRTTHSWGWNRLLGLFITLRRFSINDPEEKKIAIEATLCEKNHQDQVIVPSIVALSLRIIEKIKFKDTPEMENYRKELEMYMSFCDNRDVICRMRCRRLAINIFALITPNEIVYFRKHGFEISDFRRKDPDRLDSLYNLAREGASFCSFFAELDDDDDDDECAKTREKNLEMAKKNMSE